jgi:hypothetical protein
MKTKIALVLTALIIFVAGYFIGRNRTEQLMRQSSMRSYLFARRADGDQMIGALAIVLTQFREGNSTNGLAMLEKVLDGNIRMVSAIDIDLKETNGVSMYLQAAHDYRAKYPWTNDIPSVVTNVQNILSRAK